MTTLFHADVDAFYASVAQRDDPSLRGKPVLVGSWVVMAASYEARAHGVRGGMATSRAKRLCPDAIVVDTAFDAYMEASRAVFAIFDRFTDIVEPGSLEEAFLDMTAVVAPSDARSSRPPTEAAPSLAPTPRELAERLRREVREEVGLPLSVGVARTKVLAKIASRSAKPDGLYVVPPHGELDFLRPLPVDRIWGIGPATTRKLHAIGLTTVGQAAELTREQLVVVLGKAAGGYVHAIAHNHEPRRVRRRRGRRSFGAQRALGRRPRTPADLDTALGDLAERLAKRMQRKGRAGRTVVLRLRFGDYTRATRSCTLPHPTAEADPVAAAARRLLAAAMPLVESNGITMVGLSVTNLDGAAGEEQLELPV